MEIPFNKPFISGKEKDYLSELIHSNHKLSGDGVFTSKCSSELKRITNASKVLLTTSCTHALEMSALLIDIQPGDEVIMPSFTFVSSANPFVLRGARIVFVDVRPDTMNLDEKLVEMAITSNTKAIVPIHYAGVAAEMNFLMDLAEKYGLWVIEDAAQCIDAFFENKHLGTIGHLGTISFHDTKNLHCGEGGCLLVNDPRLVQKAEIIREKGTNRSLFLRGEIDKYTWVDRGSSYLPSELNTAFLLAQLEHLEDVTSERRSLWRRYRDGLSELIEDGRIEIQKVEEDTRHNGHIFYIKLRNLEERDSLIRYLRTQDIHAVFHYVPLHSAIAGREYGYFSGLDNFTTRESERLVRLPLWKDMPKESIDHICSLIDEFLH